MKRTELVEIHPIKNGNIYVKILDGKDFTIEELKKAFVIFEEMAEGKPYTVINDARGITVGHIPSEVFKINSSKQLTPNQIAEAYVFDSLHIRLLLNLYFKLFKPVIPAKMFECPNAAEKWLAKIEVRSVS